MDAAGAVRRHLVKSAGQRLVENRDIGLVLLRRREDGVDARMSMRVPVASKRVCRLLVMGLRLVRARSLLLLLLLLLRNLLLLLLLLLLRMMMSVVATARL